MPDLRMDNFDTLFSNNDKKTAMVNEVPYKIVCHTLTETEMLPSQKRTSALAFLGNRRTPNPFTLRRVRELLRQIDVVVDQCIDVNVSCFSICQQYG